MPPACCTCIAPLARRLPVAKAAMLTVHCTCIQPAYGTCVTPLCGKCWNAADALHTCPACMLR
eukprot:scaffold36178_cov25-Tisochrysis_lutea.AAC.1